MSAALALSVLGLVYFLGFAAFTLFSYVGWAARWPHQREPWAWSAADLAISALGGVLWLPMLFDADVRETPFAGLRYLTTDWDPWEDKGPRLKAKLKGGSFTLPNTLSTRGSVPGYNADPADVVEGSEPLVGHRVWRLFEDDRGPVLGSTVAKHLYTGPVARTDRDEVDEGLGFFAAKDGHPFYDGERPSFVVEGTVELFGRVVEGSKGYRAEKVRIQSLTLRPGGWHEAARRVPDGADRQFCACETAERPWPYPYTDLVEALSERYRCEVAYEPRKGTNAFDCTCRGAAATHNGFTQAILQTQNVLVQQVARKADRAIAGGADWDSDLLVKPADLLATPDPKDIYRYGNGG